MGKAIITQNNGGGLYTADLIYDVSGIDAQIDALNIKINRSVQATQPQISATVAALTAALAAKEIELNAAIAAGDDTRIIVAEKNSLLQQEADASRALAIERTALAGYRSELHFLEKYSAPTASRSVWCVDYTIDIPVGTLVGTIDVPDEPNKPCWIKPGGTDGSGVAYLNSDGIIAPAVAMTPAGWFYNTALLPGVQKWAPMYRKGTIIFKDAGLCQVDLDGTASSQESLDVNQEEVLAGVPFDYMGIGDSVFNVGDEVIVEFTPVNPGISELNYTAKVIGFADNPRATGIIVRLTQWLTDVPYGSAHKDDIYFKIFDSNKTDVTANFAPEYKDMGGADSYFLLRVASPEAIDPDGYWVEYVYDTRGVSVGNLANWRYGNTRLTQYPFVEADMQNKTRKTQHLVKLGTQIEDYIHHLEFTDRYGARQDISKDEMYFVEDEPYPLINDIDPAYLPPDLEADNSFSVLNMRMGFPPPYTYEHIFFKGTITTRVTAISSGEYKVTYVGEQGITALYDTTFSPIEPLVVEDPFSLEAFVLQLGYYAAVYPQLYTPDPAKLDPALRNVNGLNQDWYMQFIPPYNESSTMRARNEVSYWEGFSFIFDGIVYENTGAAVNEDKDMQPTGKTGRLHTAEIRENFPANISVLHEQPDIDNPNVWKGHSLGTVRYVGRLGVKVY